MGVLEAFSGQGPDRKIVKTIVVSIFTANYFGSGDRLEEAIGRIAEQVGAYFTYRQ